MVEIIGYSDVFSEDVAFIEKMCFASPWSERSVKEFYSDKNSVAFLAKENKKIVGYIGGRSLFDEGEIENLAVLSEYRNRKIGEALLCSLLSHFEKKGVVSVFLEVRRSNSAAQKLYMKNGFEKISERKNYYKEPLEDALILKKTLSEKK